MSAFHAPASSVSGPSNTNGLMMAASFPQGSPSPFLNLPLPQHLLFSQFRHFSSASQGLRSAPAHPMWLQVPTHQLPSVSSSPAPSSTCALPAPAVSYRRNDVTSPVFMPPQMQMPNLGGSWFSNASPALATQPAFGAPLNASNNAPATTAVQAQDISLMQVASKSLALPNLHIATSSSCTTSPLVSAVPLKASALTTENTITTAKVGVDMATVAAIQGAGETRGVAATAPCSPQTDSDSSATTWSDSTPLPVLFSVEVSQKKKERVRRRYQCKNCPHTFASIFSLNRHQSVHAQDKKYKCQVQGCSKGFYSVEGMKRHELVHTGRRPFVCNFSGCSKSFVDRGNLKRHSLVHLRRLSQST